MEEPFPLNKNGGTTIPCLVPHEDVSQLPGYEEEELFGTHVAQQELVADEEGQVKKNTGEEVERNASPTEIFFDLILAATTAKLAKILEPGLSSRPKQMLYFVIIFQLIYESWLQVRLTARQRALLADKA